MTTIRAMIW